ncbi:phage terminase small subunit [Hathewaya proteolytica DSM 3090]|uniref:Phage terminase small subunit n=1 Tax=Hathewaya proteolytica DSM 3090 TaxID=1121331 RepID=A0A1M6S146_9CLOT|nr:phage terminase small subunit [Hathewaya proteolytica DSM 3090]
MAKLTPKQMAFCDYYIETGNATEAAKQAGYKQPHVQGSQNLEKLSIKSYIDERMKQLEDERIANASEVLKHLTAAMRGKIVEDVVVVEGEGDGYSSARVIKKEISAKDRIKAAELLGKRYRLFVDKVETDVTATVNSTEKLDSILSQLNGDEDE